MDRVSAIPPGKEEYPEPYFLHLNDDGLEPKTARRKATAVVGIIKREIVGRPRGKCFRREGKLLERRP